MIETLLAVAVAGALAAAAVPISRQLSDQWRLTAFTNELVLALLQARSEAMLRKTRVVVAAASPGDWARGWRVFIDQNANGSADDGEVVLREFGPAPLRLTMQAHFGIYDGRALAFDDAGLPRRAGSNALLLGRIVLRLGDGVRAVCFSAAGFRTTRAAHCD